MCDMVMLWCQLSHKCTVNYYSVEVVVESRKLIIQWNYSCIWILLLVCDSLLNKFSFILYAMIRLHCLNLLVNLYVSLSVNVNVVHLLLSVFFSLPLLRLIRLVFSIMSSWYPLFLAICFVIFVSFLYYLKVCFQFCWWGLWTLLFLLMRVVCRIMYYYFRSGFLVIDVC